MIPKSHRMDRVTSVIFNEVFCEMRPSNRDQRRLNHNPEPTESKIADFQPFHIFSHIFVFCCIWRSHADKRCNITLPHSRHASTFPLPRVVKYEGVSRHLPRCFVLWIHHFLRDRRACAEINGVWSRSRPFRAGLLQGSLMAPTLFTLTRRTWWRRSSGSRALPCTCAPMTRQHCATAVR